MIPIFGLDFEDIQDMFHLKELGIEMVRLWCM